VDLGVVLILDLEIDLIFLVVLLLFSGHGDCGG